MQIMRIVATYHYRHGIKQHLTSVNVFLTETELKTGRERVGPRSKSSQWEDYATPSVRAFQQSHVYYPYAATCTYPLKLE